MVRVLACVVLVLGTARASGPAKPPGPPLPPAKAAKLQRLLVFDFSVQGEATKALARTLSDVAVREASRLGTYQVLSQTDVTAQLSLEHQRQILGCSADRSCLAEIAGAIDAERTLSGTVTKLGAGYFITASFFDTTHVATLNGAEETVKDPKPDELLEAVRRVVYRAITGKLRDVSGVIEFEVADAGTTILLDGETVARGPFTGSRRVPEGSHRVIVSRPGHATWESVIRLEAGGRAHVVPRLVALPPEGAPMGKRALGWSAVGTAALAAGLGGYALWKESDARGSYSDARALLGDGGVLPVSANAGTYRGLVDAGNTSHHAAVVGGVGAGVALASTVVLGYLSYRTTGEIGPFRF